MAVAAVVLQSVLDVGPVADRVFECEYNQTIRA
jgi:hypothetical protein